MRKCSALLLCLLFSLALLFTSCRKEKNTGSQINSIVSIKTADTSSMDFSFSDRDLSAEYDTNVTSVTLDKTEAEQKITKEGTYVFSGTLTDRMIVVEAGAQDKVQIVLDGAVINNKNGPAIYVKSADKVFITLKDGTENTVSDGSSYNITDDDSTLDAAIFSRADLCLNGGGSLTLSGNYKHGIVSKDDLTIAECTLNITAQNVGLNGKDCVKIASGNITVKAGSDGIRSDNTEDTSRGYVYLEGGTLTITAGNDGIQAETALKAENVTLNIKAGGGSGYTLSSSSESYKGLKAGSDIFVSGGSFTIDSMDDCIHSNNTISITGGTFDLSGGDDGIHADTDLSVSGGDIFISKSYEGLEASLIIISGGNIDLIASDDGLNAAGGNDSSAMGGRFGQGGFSSSTGEIIISGGYTLVNALGDGIDSNGTISISGGITLVSGPTNNANGSFDYDGSASVTGGVLIALGSSGMAQSFSSAQNQGAIFASFTSQSENTSFALCDESGKAIVSFTPKKAYQSAVITAPGVQSGKSYTIVAGASISGADKNGYAENAVVSGGTTLLSIEMTGELYGSGGMHGGGMHGGGMHGGGNFGGGMGRPMW